MGLTHNPFGAYPQDGAAVDVYDFDEVILAADEAADAAVASGHGVIDGIGIINVHFHVSLCNLKIGSGPWPP